MSEFAKLLARWNERDHRYGMRRIAGQAAPLEHYEAIAIKSFRRKEIEDLPEHERQLARLELDRWGPPPVSTR